jgi:hypothetical protein
MKVISGFIIALFMVITVPGLAQDQPSSNDIIVKMKTGLDLQEDQVTNITPIIEKYSIEFQDLQKSINDGTINQSAIDSQRQGIEDAETQELSAYLKPYQLSQWRELQGQIYQQKDNGNSDDANDDADEYSNLPRNSGGN